MWARGEIREFDLPFNGRDADMLEAFDLRRITARRSGSEEFVASPDLIPLPPCT
jgi:hypothetical protein